MTTTDPIDIRAGTKRQAIVAKVLRERGHQPAATADYIAEYIRDAEAVLLALDEHDSFDSTGELEELRAAGTLLTAAQTIRLEVARMLVENLDDSIGAFAADILILSDVIEHGQMRPLPIVPAEESQ